MAEEDEQQADGAAEAPAAGDDLDLDVDGDKQTKPKASLSKLMAGKLKYVVIALAASALVGVGVGISYFIFVKSPTSAAVVDPEAGSDGDSYDDEIGKDGVIQGVMEGEALYVDFVPTFMVHIKDTTGYVTYLQLEISVLMRDKRVQKAVRDHNSLIKNNVLTMLNQKSYRELQPIEAREKLRREILEEVRNVVKEQENIVGVEDVLITNFVMQ